MSKSSESGRPAERVGRLLVIAAGAAQASASARLEPLGLSPRSWGVLSTLAESGPSTQVELASATGIDRTAMVYLLDDLERQELVERKQHPADRRSYLVHLTRRGQRTQQKAAAALARQAETLLAPLEAGEREQLVRLLARIADHWERLQSTTEAARPAQALQALESLAGAAEHDDERGSRRGRSRPRRQKL